MKKILLLTVAGILSVVCTKVMAQTDFSLDPSTIDPSDTGYYEYGVPADLNGNDVIEEGEWASGCPDPDDYWGDDDFWETGYAHGFFYANSIVMPDCPTKNEPAPGVPLGYVMLAKNNNAGTDSATGGYIVSPAIKDLESIKIILSPDVGPRSDRPVTLWIEYSKDSITWDDVSYIDLTMTADADKAGHIYELEAGSDAALDTMISASTQGSIVLRASSAIEQRVKVHSWVITADTGSFAVSNNERRINLVSEFFTVKDNIICSNAGEIEVFNILGQFIGRGTAVTVERSNIYIVRASSGYTRKVFVY